MTRAAKAAGARGAGGGHAGAAQLRRQYGEAFFGLFAKVAKAEGAALVPFLLGRGRRADASRCSRPTASTPAPPRIRACWPTCGRWRRLACGAS
jgi:acyl-CoA thioesterase-1